MDKEKDRTMDRIRTKRIELNRDEKNRLKQELLNRYNYDSESLKNARIRSEVIIKQFPINCFFTKFTNQSTYDMIDLKLEKVSSQTWEVERY
jgi:hypothetical protein